MEKNGYSPIMRFFAYDLFCTQGYIANITLRREEFWNLAQTPQENFKTQMFHILPWRLKAKFQIPPLRSVMFAVNTTTRAAWLIGNNNV